MGIWKKATWGIRAYLAVPPNPFRFDPRLDRLVAELCASIGENEIALNLGSGTTTHGERIVNVDMLDAPTVDVRSDAHHLPFRSKSFAGVLLRGVLEHVEDAETVMAEVCRVAAPGAFIYVEVPFLQPYHRSPEDYRRFTLPGLEAYLADLESVRSGVQVGPFSSLAWILRESLASLVSCGSSWWYRKAVAVFGWLTFWIRYLDAIVADAPHVSNSASALYFLGRAPRAREAGSR